MANKSVFLISLLMMAFILPGCPYNSDTPLSPPEKAGIDASLLGTWVMKKSPDPVNSCRILQFNEHELLIIVQSRDEQDLYRAFTTTINGVKFLNVRKIVDTSTDAAHWLFLRYTTVGDELRYRYVEDTLPERDKLSSKTYIDLIKRNPKNPELYDAESDGVLVRTKDQLLPIHK